MGTLKKTGVQHLIYTFYIEAVLCLHCSLKTRFILVLSLVHLLLNHSSTYMVLSLHSCFSKVSKNHVSRGPPVLGSQKFENVITCISVTNLTKILENSTNTHTLFRYLVYLLAKNNCVTRSQTIFDDDPVSLAL